MVPIDSAGRNPQDGRLVAALAAATSSTRLHAALAIGTHPDPGLVDVLVARCAVEPDFFVRDMLTWALTRLPPEITVPKLRAELGSARAQARSQALHTLSKIGDKSVWPAITRALLRDADDEVARAAWRTAAVLVPDGEREALAAELAGQLGRGDREVRLSLSRALVALGNVVEPVLRTAMTHHDPAVRAHAGATERILHDPDAGFDLAMDEAKRVVALGPDRRGDTDADR
ncbi:HEAT repeat domain-containing protein [Micromonospora sp. WMMD718]|uniref:HEAT repeat domain-containing protein n=1 Tax=unclassified Micromonospora TaxID=2617518 RepID=UPI000AD12425|nr:MULTISPECIES: HEAT repeat domain-containing protein [unclassified Micromonospora]MDG4753539.1 HEAT repeat domain-containing protein [Micromonospora sp. WMMD718]